MNVGALAKLGVRKVLVADDQPLVRGLVRRILAADGCEVCEAPNGCRAVELLAGAARDADLALLDVHMPGMCARELYEGIRAVQPDLPLVFFTGSPPGDPDRGWVEASGLTLLEKPFTLQAFRSAFRRTLQGTCVG